MQSCHAPRSKPNPSRLYGYRACLTFGISLICMTLTTSWLGPYNNISTSLVLRVTRFSNLLVRCQGATPRQLTPPRSNRIQLVTIAIVEALVVQVDDRNWAPSRDIAICACLAHTRGSIVRACTDHIRFGFLRFNLPTWLMGLWPDHRNRAQHKQFRFCDLLS